MSPIEKKDPAQMSEREQRNALRHEANRLEVSRLLLVMAACCFAMNGLESGLRCLREGKEQKIGES